MPRLYPPERRLDGRLGTTVDFWQWAFSDLRSNNVRGVLAEWIVAQLLGLSPETRGSWDDFDLILPDPDGRKIEVKASAYVQAWPQKKPSIIQFTGLKGHRWIDHEQRRHTAEKTYNADIYIFCVQTMEVPESWDAFDLRQWDFYVAPRSDVAIKGTSSLRLSTVESFAKRISADQLRRAV
jgi:hypothetical protein